MAYLTQLDTSTLSNQNISSALLVHTFTNTTRLRKIFIDVFANQIAGDGDYVVYATRQRSGTGAAYEIGGRTTVAVPSGVTSQMFPTIALLCGATDVIKVYVVGLGGDTTTPDIITDVSEEFVATDSNGRVDVSLIEGVDATDQIRDSIVSDATRFPGGYVTNIKEKVDALPFGSDFTAWFDAIPTANENADALLDRSAGIETGFTPRQGLRLILAALAGKLSISGNTVTIRDMADSKDRITATTDSDGQRTAVTRDAT